jgi:hypothetical protein
MALVGALIGLLPSLHIHGCLGLTLWSIILLLILHPPSFAFFFAGYSASVTVHIPRLVSFARLLEWRPLWESCVLSGRFFCSLHHWFDWLGLFPLVALILPLFVCHRREFSLVIATIATAFFSTRISLGPPQRFNLLTFHFAALPPACVFFLVLLHRVSVHFQLPAELRGFLSAVLVTIAALGVGSALTSFWERFPAAPPAFGPDEAAAAAWIRANSARSAVFAFSGGDRELSPAALAGRVSFAAPAALAAELGIDAAPRRALLRERCGAPAADWEDVDFFIARDGARPPCSLSDARWSVAGRAANYTIYRRLV